jgi:CubicO group peptidase (beta-lactamase class C family)
MSHSTFDPAMLAATEPLLNAFVERDELAGIVTLTSHRGEIVMEQAIGWRDRELRRPMQRDTMFRIASMSKPITSVAALMLIEEGKLSLDDAVTRWIPELADLNVLLDPAGSLDHVVPARRAMTVEDLMTHRSGLAYAPFSEGPLQRAYEDVLLDPGMNRLSADEWLRRLGTLPLAYQPGERFHYGHSTDVLGFLLGRIEGKSFRQVLADRVFGPLDMHDTDFWLPPAKRDRLASLYSYEEAVQGLKRVDVAMYDDLPEYTPGGGGLISTAPDYHRFARMLLNDGMHEGIRLLKPETVQLMLTNRLTPAQRHHPFAGMPLWQKSGFGLGVSIAEDLTDNPYACGSVGSITWPGIFGTWWQADPVHDLIMIYLVQHQVPVSANSGSTIATGTGAAGRQALPIYQQAVYSALSSTARVPAQ